MKKIFLILLILYIDLYSLEKESTLKLYVGIFSTLSSQNLISVYTNDKEYIDIFKYSKYIKLTSKIEDANIALITNLKTLRYVLKKNIKTRYKRRPILFATNYKLLKESTSIVGAFYWRKGRSQLLFIKNRLSRYGIKLSYDYQKFTIESL